MRYLLTTVVDRIREMWTRHETEYDWDIEGARKEALDRLDALLPGHHT